MTTKGEVLIKVENLQKQFGENKVLDGISTEIHKGEVAGYHRPRPVPENPLFSVL